MSAYSKEEPDAIPIGDPYPHGGYKYFMNPNAFQQIEREVYRGQRHAAASADQRIEAWRYSGETDLVSFMCYAREPDWASLRSVRIEESERTLSLGRITEGLTRWDSGDVDEQFAPGGIPEGAGEHLRPFAGQGVDLDGFGGN